MILSVRLIYNLIIWFLIHRNENKITTLSFKDWYSVKKLDGIKKQYSSTNRSILMCNNSYQLSPRILTIAFDGSTKKFKDKIERYSFYLESNITFNNQQIDLFNKLVNEHQAKTKYLVFYSNFQKNSYKCKVESKKLLTNFTERNPQIDFQNLKLRIGGGSDPMDVNFNFCEDKYCKKSSQRVELMLADHPIVEDFCDPIVLTGDNDIESLGAFLRGLVTKIVLIGEKNFQSMKVEFKIEKYKPSYAQIDFIVAHLRNKVDPFNIQLTLEYPKVKNSFYIKFSRKKTI